MTGSRQWWMALVAGVMVLTVGSVAATAQTSDSASLAAELSQLMDGAGLSAAAAEDPAEDERFVAALYFSGRQILAVSATYSAPLLLQEKIAAGNYRDVYIDLNSASDPASRVFVDDLGADGLQAEPIENGPHDTYDRGGRSLTLDGDWSRQQMSEDEYRQAFGEADDDFADILKLLIEQIR